MSKVLIIDDDKKILLSFGHKLKKLGFDVLTTDNAPDGLEHLKSCKNIDIVLLDYVMPNMNGLQAFEVFKQTLNDECPPVIMMTFNTDYKVATQFIQAGGTDFVEKSVNPKELKIKIERAIINYIMVKKATRKQLEAERKLKATNGLLLEKTAQLKKQAEALKQSNQELKNFTDIVAHDLKEPLRNISNSLQFIKWDFAEKIDPKAEEYIEFAINGAIRLTHMIQGLTHYADINSVLPFKKVDFNNIIEEVKANLKGQLEEGNVQILIKNQLPTEIIAHKYQLIQLFQNLISNAIKFKKKEEDPIINISYESLPTHWQFSIKDNGIGFDENYSKRIFKIFQRLHTPQDYQGSGIGLSICQKIVQRHDGHIEAFSKAGEGATFQFTISKKLSNR